MPSIAWNGVAPDRDVLAALKAHGVSIDREVTDGLPLVVATASSRRVPAPPCGRRRWIWLCAEPVGHARAMDATVRGAYDIVSRGAPDAVATLLRRIDELVTPEPRVRPPDWIVTASGASRAVIEGAARVAGTSMPVLLTGETGTGKEVTARLIHAWSPRHDKRFVPINCAAIPNELMEAELFGYARGAFSGAVQAYDGQLTAAAGGSVFLDEIDDTPLEIQVKLLRVVEDRVVNRLGENVWREVDFRIIAATNRDLEPLVAEGCFGADLYERLAIVRIHLVPLRERLEDLPALADHFLERFAREQKQPRVTIRADTLQALAAYAWPGNIRELRNVLYETLVYKRAGSEVLPSNLPSRILKRGAAAAQAAVDTGLVRQRVRDRTMNLKREIEALERAALDAALDTAGGNASEAARLLGTVGRGAARDPGGTVRAMKRRLGYRG
jgi:DNA-binding NtrC family response regulator